MSIEIFECIYEIMARLIVFIGISGILILFFNISGFNYKKVRAK